MKITHLLLLFFISWSQIMLAQISESEKSMSLGIKNGITLELPDTKEKLVEKLWKKYARQFKGRTKRNKKADEYYTEKGRMDGVGSDLNIYTKINGSGSDVYLTCWIDMGGTFLSSYNDSDKYIEAEKELMRFALEVTREKIRIELEGEEDRLKKLNKNLKKLERSNASYHREIEQAKERIKKAEANIEQNEVDQEETRSAIELQEEAVEKVRKRLSDL